MAFNVQAVVVLLAMASVAKADVGRTSVAVEGAYLTARDRFQINGPFASWEPKVGPHDQLLTALAARHVRDSGLMLGVRLGRIDGEPVVAEDDQRSISGDGPEVTFDRRYTLWAPSAQVGYHGDRWGIEVGMGVVIGPDDALRAGGVRGLFGDLTTKDGDGKLWFEMSVGEVDSLPEVSQFGLGAGVDVGWLRLRAGLEAVAVPTYERGQCEECGVAFEADGGGFFADATVHLGDVGLRVRGVASQDPRGLLGLNYTF